MNKAVKEKWLKALRSGEYKQGKGILKNPKNEYCCLGVLCDLYIKEHHGVRWVSRRFYRGYGLTLDIFEEEGGLPKSVKTWANLHSYILGNTETSLLAHNDGNGYRNITPKSFNEIADLIEEYL